ncbi:bomanin Bicipital 1 [Drosophila ficusphila]|uniref:bomanin Bicipital 1 n=1 Tax=Drosophila ficusphila TaxID=30025 RepID=UPI0007E5D8FA|nr:bomanin Bicipital 1 [Drosophila ficusphila]
MKYLTCVVLLLSIIPALIGAPNTVVVNGVCLTCPNPNGERVILDGQEYRSFSSPGSSGNVVISRGNRGGEGGTTVYRRGGTTIVNGRCQHCNVDY